MTHSVTSTDAKLAAQVGSEDAYRAAYADGDERLAVLEGPSLRYEWDPSN